jgi:hypothetical protein
VDVEPPKALPDPLICGPEFPKLRLVMRGGRQVTESKSNDNVRMGKAMFDSSGTVSMARVGRSLHACDVAHAECEGWCPLVAAWQDMPDDEGDWYDGWAVNTGGEIKFPSCPAIERLASHCQTAPQRRFFDLWCRYFTRPAEAPLTRADEEWGPHAAERARAMRLDFPALIPEVWLNYLGPNKSADDELHLEENPSRVDFVMVAAGKKCVIEIDGKSHYADYHRDASRWVPDERRYTRNLKIERSLRRQGWEIYRFSDLEVSAVAPEKFLDLVFDLPGVTVW